MANSSNNRNGADTRTARPTGDREVRQLEREDSELGEMLPFRTNRASRSSTQRTVTTAQRSTSTIQRTTAPQGNARSAYQGQGGQRPASYQEQPRRVELPRSSSERRQTAQQPMRKQPARKRGGNGTRGGGQAPLWAVPVILVCLALLAVAGWYVQSEYGRYQQYLALRDRVNRNVFYQNTFVDNVDISGQTLDQAIALLKEQSERNNADFQIAISYGASSWRIDSTQVPVGAKYESALRFAYAYGRSGSLQQRFSDMRAVETNGMFLNSEWGYDYVKVRELTNAIADSITQPAADARLTAFDPNTKAFLSEPERDGVEADADRLYAEVITALDAKRYDATIQVLAEKVQPKLRQADINSQFGRISSYSTATTNSANRNTNIALSSQAVNGRVVLPGDTLSFNECTGQRTPEKGYLEAGAISGGQLVDETGGGVCQTSSTLFNAVVRADLEIVSRTQHSWPSTYVPRGEDAAVDWPRLDFKFRNNGEYPVFIVAAYSDKKVTVEVYGKLLGPGRSIDLASTTVQENRPSDEVIYTRSLDLATNTTKVAKEKRTGYVVDTYKVYYENGVEVERKKLWRTEYKPVQKEIYFN